MVLLTIVSAICGFVSLELQRTTAAHEGEGKFRTKGVRRMVSTPLVMLDVLTFAEIEIGTKSYRLLVDTGSSTLAIPGNRCEKCLFRLEGQYYSEQSTSKVLPCDDSTCSGRYRGGICGNSQASTPPCPFGVQYADQTSESGYIVTDNVKIGTDSVLMHLGIITEAVPPDSFSAMSVDGILGVGGRAINFGNPPFGTLPEEICHKYSYPNILAMDIGVHSSPGVLHIGGYDSKRASSMVWTSMRSDSGWYVVKPTHLNIGGYAITNSASDFGDVIVDSGTTFTFVPPDIYNSIKSLLQTKFSHLPGVTASFSGKDIFSSGQCFEMDLKQYPVLYFTFDGDVTVAVPPSGYFAPAHAGGVTYQCFGIASSGATSQYIISPRQTILGDTFMSSFYVVFDTDNNKMGLGISPSNANIPIPPAGSGVVPPLTPPTYFGGLSQLNVLLIAFAIVPAIVLWHFKYMNSDASPPQSVLVASGPVVTATKYGTM